MELYKTDHPPNLEQNMGTYNPNTNRVVTIITLAIVFTWIVLLILLR